MEALTADSAAAVAYAVEHTVAPAALTDVAMAVVLPPAVTVEQTVAEGGQVMAAAAAAAAVAEPAVTEPAVAEPAVAKARVPYWFVAVRSAVKRSVAR